MTGPARAGAWAPWLLILLVAAIHCATNASVSFEVTLPASVGAEAAWVEVGAFQGACPPASQLAGGLPGGGLVTRVAFARASSSPPPVGTLPKGPYAFMGTARAADCSVVASGCVEVDLSTATDVSIAMAATSSPGGACALGETCFDARCVAHGATADAAPRSCALSFVGAGPLGDTLDVAGEVVSAPAATATPAGFLVAYREYDPGGGAARLTMALIDPGGGLSIPAPSMLPGQCSGQDESDGIGLAYAGGGIVTSARPACGTSPPGIDLFAVTASGAIGTSAFVSASGGAPSLSPAHALTLIGPGAGWLAYTTPRSAELTTLTNLSLATPDPFGDPAPSLAEVSVAPAAFALLTGNLPGADGGPTSPFLVASLGATARDAGVPMRFPGHWGAVTTAGTRAFVASDSGVAAQPVSLRVFDTALGSTITSTFAPPGSGAPAGADVAVVGDSVVTAVEQPGEISLVVLDGAFESPSFARSLLLSADGRVPSQSGLRDGKVALAASASQVLVTWVTGTTLRSSDPVGGWALYACQP